MNNYVFCPNCGEPELSTFGLVFWRCDECQSIFDMQLTDVTQHCQTMTILKKDEDGKLYDAKRAICVYEDAYKEKGDTE